MKIPGNKAQQKYFFIGALILGAIIFIYYKGVKSGKIGKPKFIKPPKDAPGQPQGSGANVRQTAIALYDDMNGYNWSGHNMTPYKNWATMNATDFVGVYNDFNNMYYEVGEGTLKEWIINEKYYDNLVDDIIIPRMGKENLT